MNQASNALQTHAVQWMERSLDDSANRRLSLGQSFLAADAIIEIMHNVASGLVVYPNVINARIQSELPFMATENIIMAMVAEGGDRQEVHEQIRIHSLAAASEVKEWGRPNDLMQRIRKDIFFRPIHSSLEELLDPNTFIGLADQQTFQFLEDEVLPVINRYQSKLTSAGSLKV